MTKAQRIRIKRTAKRIANLIDLNAPDQIVKNEIALLNQIIEDPSRN